MPVWQDSSATQYPWRKPGRIPLSKELRLISGFTPAEVGKVVAKYGRMPIKELQEKLDDPQNSVLERTIAKIWKMTLQEGDWRLLDFLFNRSIGKPMGDILEDPDTVRISQLSTNELIELIKHNIPGANVLDLRVANAEEKKEDYAKLLKDAKKSNLGSNE